MDMNSDQKVHDILSAPDHVWYNRMAGHMRTCDRHNIEDQLSWLNACCEHYCMIEYGIALRPDQATLWFESESDVIKWDLTQP